MFQKKKIKKEKNHERKARGRGQDHGTKRTIRGRSRERHNTEEWKASAKRRRNFRHAPAEE